MTRLRPWFLTLPSGLHFLTIIILLLFSFGGCSKKGGGHAGNGGSYAVIAIPGDVDSFNPLFAEDVTAGEINDLIFPGLLDSRFDTTQGVLEYQPLLARLWEYRNGNRDIIFHFRIDAKWSDGVAVTARDVQFSYELYGDTGVASVRQGSVGGLRKSKDGALDIRQAVDVLDDSTVVFHFERPYPGQLFDAGLPILPAHAVKQIPRRTLRESPFNRNPIGSGPYMLKSWKPLQEIILESSPTSVLPNPGRIPQLIFRVIPDSRSRLAQLRAGDVDLVANVRLEDAVELQKDNRLQVIRTGERIYDALNWNNLDPVEYARSVGKTIRPHPLFGDPKVRQIGEASRTVPLR